MAGNISIGTVRGTLQLDDRFTAKLKLAETQLTSAGKKAQAFGDSVSRAGSNLLPLSLALGAASTAAFKFGKDYEKVMTTVITLVGVAEERVRSFSEQTLALSKQAAKGPEELGRALFVVTSAGIRGAEAMDVLDSAAKASAAGLGDTADIARAVTAAVQAYGKETLSAADAADVMFATVREGNLDAASLAGSLGRVIGIASQVGVSFSQVGGFIATFTRLGVSAEESVTALRGLLAAMLKPSKQARDALAEVGLTFADLRQQIRDKGLAATLIELTQTFAGNEEAIAAVIPNIRALSGLLGVTGQQAEAFIAIEKSVGNATGVVATGFERASQTVDHKWNAALAGAQVAAIRLFDAFKGQFTSVVEGFSKATDKATEFIESLDEMSPAAKNILAALVGLGTIAAPALIILGGAIKLGGTALVGLGAAAGLAHKSLTALRTATVVEGAVMAEWGASTAVVSSGLVTLAGAAGIGLLIAALAKLTGVWDDAKKVATDAMDAGIAQAKTFGLVMKAAGEATAHAIGEVYEPQIKYATKLLGEFGVALDENQEHFSAWKTAFGPIGTIISYVASGVEKWKDAWEGIYAAMDLAVNGLPEVETGFKNLNDNGLRPMPPVADLLNMSLPELSAHLLAVAAGAGEMVGPVDETTKSTAQLSDEIKELRDALSGAALEKQVADLGTAWGAMTKEQQASIDSMRRMADAAQQLADSGAKLDPWMLGLIEKVSELNRLVAVEEGLPEWFEKMGKVVGLPWPPLTEGMAGAEEVVGTFGSAITGLGQDMASGIVITHGLGAEFNYMGEYLDNIEGFATDAKGGIKGLNKEVQSFGDFLKKDLGNVILSAFTGGGDIGKSIGGSIGGFLGSAGSSVGKSIAGSLTSVFGKTIGGALGSVIPGLGTLVGGFLGGSVGKLFGKLFGKSEGRKQLEEANKQIGALKQQVVGLYGSTAEAEKLAARLGINFQGIWGNQNVKGLQYVQQQVDALAEALENQKEIAADLGGQFQETFGDRGAAVIQPLLDKLAELGALTPELQAELAGMTGPDWQGMESAAERYGISLDRLGNTFWQAKLDDAFLQVVDDVAMLGGTFDEMGPKVSELVQQAMQYGVTLPAGMEPIIASLDAAGKLVDENGVKLEGLGNLTYAETMTQGIDRVVDKLQELIDTLTGGVTKGFDNVIDAAERFGRTRIKIPVDFEVNGGVMPEGGRVEGLSGGTHGFRQWSAQGTLVRLHNSEAVVPENDWAQREALAATGTDGPAGMPAIVQINLDRTSLGRGLVRVLPGEVTKVTGR